MNIKKNKEQEVIVLIITSFNQLYNFISYFQEKKLIKNKKIYFTIFSDLIPNELILNLKNYIEKFASVEILDMRRQKLSSYGLKINVLRIFFYYLFILKKILKIKKFLNVSHILVSGRMQIPVLCLMYILSKSKIFFVEDGVGEYVPYANSEKKPIFFFFLKKFLKKNTLRIKILQLSKSKKDYLRILNQQFLNDGNYLNNIELYKSFLKNSSTNTRSFAPKCIIIGTLRPIQSDTVSIKDLYIKTILEINKRYSYSFDEILFFPHPRMEFSHYTDLFKNLSKYSKVHTPSSLIVENYLIEDDIELVVGSLSTALYYAKIIFNKNKVFYLDYVQSSKAKDKDRNFLNAFEDAGIKNFFS